eukprot:5444876-Prorocentrum_lima.AAC.1
MALPTRLASREQLSPEEMTLALDARQQLHNSVDLRTEIEPCYGVDRLFPGTYYLSKISATGVRSYERLPLDHQRVVGGSMAPAGFAASRGAKQPQEPQVAPVDQASRPKNVGILAAE